MAGASPQRRQHLLSERLSRCRLSASGASWRSASVASEVTNRRVRKSLSALTAPESPSISLTNGASRASVSFANSASAAPGPERPPRRNARQASQRNTPQCAAGQVKSHRHEMRFAHSAAYASPQCSCSSPSWCPHGLRGHKLTEHPASWRCLCRLGCAPRASNCLLAAAPPAARIRQGLMKYGSARLAETPRMESAQLHDQIGLLEHCRPRS